MTAEVASAPARSRSWTLVGIVAFALFLDFFLYGIVVPLTPLSPAGVKSEDQLGFLYAAYAVSVLLVTPLFGYLGDRVGGRVMMICGVVLAASATAFFGLAPNFYLLLAARLCQGAASAATWTSGLALVAEHYPGKRVEMIGYAFTGSTAGSVLGPVLGGVMYRAGGYQFPFLVTGLLLAIEACLLILLLPASRKEQQGSVDFRALLRNKSLLMAALAVALAAFAWGIIEPLLPVRLDRYGATAQTIGLMFTVSSILYGLCAPVVGWVSDRLSVKRVLILGTLAMAFTLPSLSAFEQVGFIAVALCLVNVSYAFMLNPASAELANAADRAGMSCYSAVYAVYNIAYSIGMLATSAIASATARTLGFRGALLCVSAVLIVSTVLLAMDSAQPQPQASVAPQS
jgi:MFS family permease